MTDRGSGPEAASQRHGPELESNRRLWDEWTGIHAGSSFYDVAAFRAGGIRIADHERAEIGPVAGLRLLHLQCHFGLDTLSWARLGASVTGVDFSPRAIALARSLAADLGIAAQFVESDIYRLPAVLDGTFDLVYTSNGVLGWLPEIGPWAEVVARYVRPGGRFYLLEVHPVVLALADEGVEPGELRLAYPYWEHRDPIEVATQGSYADRTARIDTPREFGWDRSLGEIVTALVTAGLRIDRLTEYPFLNWAHPVLVADGEGRYRLPPGTKGELPLMFSVLASKPA
ncbi:MAG TPA: class I SAM-dependent methyltransferase [Candidatus Limnocylindrales bacterium]